LAFWSEFASAFAAQVHSLCASVTAVYLSFFVFGRVLTRLDSSLHYIVSIHVCNLQQHTIIRKLALMTVLILSILS